LKKFNQNFLFAFGSKNIFLAETVVSANRVKGVTPLQGLGQRPKEFEVSI